MKTIQLTTKESQKDNKVYYLSGITKEQKDDLLKAQREGNLKLLSNFIRIKCENVTKLDLLANSKPSAIRNEIGFIYGPRTEDRSKTGVNASRPVHYRLYSKTEQEQRDSAYLLNLCEDSSISARSAFSQLNTEYCCVWFDYKTL